MYRSRVASLPQIVLALTLGFVLVTAGPLRGDDAPINFSPEIKAAKRLCESINPHWINAVIAAEDHNFLDRPRGASKITTFAAEMLHRLADRDQSTNKRHARQIATTLSLSVRATHAEIVCIVLQLSNFGRGVHGHDTAARVFFRKGANELTLAEIATLAGFLKAPTQFSSSVELARERRNAVLHDMRALNMIDEGTLQTALAEPLMLPR